MSKHDAHISDQDLLRAADGELPGREAARIQAHLEACWDCRTRRADLEQTITDFITAHRRDPRMELPPIDGPQAQLLARLAQLPPMAPLSPWQRVRQSVLFTRSAVYAGLGLCAVVLTVLLVNFSAQSVRAASIPDASLTPGATRQVTRDDICSARPVTGFYPIPATLAYRVFEKYKIRNPRPRSYEVDYLITPALGGADDVRNLWPQPFASGEWNAHVKDALEDYLQREVCAGRVDLQTAQRDIAVNWIAAYQKYFRTDRPLASHSNFSLDTPWED